jgi:3-isopropylmalate dehydrogenase
MREFRIVVLAGDGIGKEVMASCLSLLEEDVLSQTGGFRLRFEPYEAGAELYRRTGVSLPDEVWLAAESADAVLFGAMGLPDVRYPNGTEVLPQIEFRERLDLYAGVRPIRILSGARTPLADPRARTVDCVLVRESTEGLFAARSLSRRDGDEAVYDTMRISRKTCDRLFAFAFNLARRRAKPGRRPRVTCIDKANVLPSMAFFRERFLASAASHPDIDADCAYVDATALRLVRAPWDFDVLVTENMFGDILSDLGAALLGGMGMAPSADIGDRHGVFQPCHGTAPDIVGQGLANPTAMVLSAAMMLDWLGDRHGLVACCHAALELTRAVERAFADGTLLPIEAGGTDGTATITARIRQELQRPVPTEFTA